MNVEFGKLTLEQIAQLINQKPADGPGERKLSGKTLDFNYVPSKVANIIRFKGEKVCDVGNLMSVVSPPGTGKSQVSAAIASAGLNPNCDSLGFEVDLDDEKTILLIDSEQTHDDCYINLMRVGKRAGVEFEYNKQTRIYTPIQHDLIKQKTEGGAYAYNRFTYHSIISIPKKADRMRELEILLEDLNVGLLILDGCGDFVNDPNDPEESNYFVHWLVALQNKLQFGTFATIHPNPKDNKPRGHLGSEVHRKAQCLLLMSRTTDSREVREISMSFEYGKNRGGADNINTFFQYDQESRLFLTCDHVPSEAGSKEAKIKINFIDLFEQLFQTENKKAFGFSELAEFYKNAGYTKNKSTAEAHIKSGAAAGILAKDLNNKYYLTIS